MRNKIHILHDANGSAIKVIKKAKGKYEPDFSDWMLPRCDVVGIATWPDGANRDKSSDGYACFNISEHVSVDGVEIYTGVFEADNWRELRLAILQVSFQAWCCDDI